MLYKQVEMALSSPKIRKYIPWQLNCVRFSAALRPTFLHFVDGASCNDSW